MKVLDWIRSQNRNKDTKGVNCITNAGASMVDLEGRLVTVTRVDGEPRVEPAPGWYRFVPLQGS